MYFLLSRPLNFYRWMPMVGWVGISGTFPCFILHSRSSEWHGLQFARESKRHCQETVWVRRVLWRFMGKFYALIAAPALGSRAAFRVECVLFPRVLKIIMSKCSFARNLGIFIGNSTCCVRFSQISSCWPTRCLHIATEKEAKKSNNPNVQHVKSNLMVTMWYNKKLQAMQKHYALARSQHMFLQCSTRYLARPIR